jgi:desulfoferrodoxin (superoxide reductase-like protein)
LIDESAASGNGSFVCDGFYFPVGFDFSIYKIPGNISFREAHFASIVRFRDRNFTGLDCNQADFSAGLELSNVEFDHHIEWVSLKVGNQLILNNCQFNGEFRLEQANIADFLVQKSHFTNYVVFGQCTFYGITLIEETEFDGRVLWSGCNSSGHFNLIRSKFERDFGIVNCKFPKECLFHDVKFKQIADISRTQYHGPLKFSLCHFDSAINFDYTSFPTVCHMHKCKMTNHVRLTWPGIGKPLYTNADGLRLERGTLIIEDPEFENKAILDLSDNRFPEDAQLLLNDCDMRAILLTGAETDRIHYVNCHKWPLIGERQSLRDEKVLLMDSGSPDKWRKLAASYQGLVKYFSSRDLQLANNFQAGVFEARRRAAKATLPKHGSTDFIWLSLYRWGSSYSTSVSRPILWLLFILAAFPFAYWSTSIRPEVDPLFWNSFNVCLQVSTLFGAAKEFVRDNALWFNLIVMLQVVLTFALVSLFLLALRKNFKHQ